MATFSPQAAARIVAATRRNEQTPRGHARGERGRPAVYPGTCVFHFTATSTISARSGASPGSGTANITGISPATGSIVTLRTGVTVRNMYSSEVPLYAEGTCYIDGPYLVVQGWECV